VFFSSATDKAATLDEVADFANVPLPTALAKVKAGLFKPSAKSKALTWPPSTSALEQALAERDPVLHRVWGMGATVSLLAAIANRGDTSVAACRIAFDPQEVSPESLGNPMLLALFRWASASPADDSDGRPASMLLATLHAIVNEKQAADDVGRVADSRQAVLGFLQQQGAQLDEPRQRDALEKLQQDLSGMLGFGGDTGGELLQHHRKPYARALILFFLREDCKGLLDYRHELLNEMDVIVAVMLFSAATGWRSLPNALRGAAGPDAISQRMAASAQQAADSGLELGPAPAYLRSLRDLLTPGDRGWNSKQQQAALALARGMDWTDIVHTRISLGKGEYQLRIDGSGAHILLDGEVKAVTITVDPPELLARLSTRPPPPKLEAAVRRLAP